MKVKVFNRLERLSAFLFFLFLPLQTRVFLSGPASLERTGQGEFIEWTSIFFYISDAFFVAVICLWLFRVFFSRSTIKIDKPAIVLGVVASLFFVSAFGAINEGAAFFRAVKMLELWTLFVWIRSSNIALCFFARPFVASGVFQAIVGIAQFGLQKSLGLTYFAESPLVPLQDNVAHITGASGKLIRAYGLVPSPNVFAFFMVATIFFLIFLYIKNKINLYLYATLSFIVCLALILSFSRASITSGVLFLFVFAVFLFNSKNIKRQLVFRSFSVLVFSFLASSALFFENLRERFFEAIKRDNAVSERVDLYEVAASFKPDIFSGYGGGNITLLDDRFVQPIHNSFLMIFYEAGILAGVLFFSVMLYALWKNARALTLNSSLLFCLLGTIMLIGMADHFFVTLQQGGLVLWIIAALAFNEREKSDII